MYPTLRGTKEESSQAEAPIAAQQRGCRISAASFNTSFSFGVPPLEDGDSLGEDPAGKRLGRLFILLNDCVQKLSMEYGGLLNIFAAHTVMLTDQGTQHRFEAPVDHGVKC